MVPHGWLAKLAAGAAVAVIGPAVFRPLLVGILRAGYEARDKTAEVLQEAHEGVRSIRADAMASRAGSVDAEVRRLRAEAAELRARLSARGD